MSKKLFLTAALLFICAGPYVVDSQKHTADAWPTAKPASVGLDEKAIAALDADIKSGKYGNVDSLTIRVGGRRLRVPSRAAFADVRGADTLRIALEIEDATATDTRDPAAERGDGLANRGLARPYFVQMKGRARISGRVGGQVVSGEGAGFFETYR